MAPRSTCQKLLHDGAIAFRILLEHPVLRIRDNSSFGAGNMLGQDAPILGERASGVGAADQERRRPDRDRVGLAVRLASFMQLAEQRDDVVAQLLFGRGGEASPGAIAVNAIA